MNVMSDCPKNTVLFKKRLDTFLRPMYHIGVQKVTNAQRLMEIVLNFMVEQKENDFKFVQIRG